MGTSALLLIIKRTSKNPRAYIETPISAHKNSLYPHFWMTTLVETISVTRRGGKRTIYLRSKGLHILLHVAFIIYIQYYYFAYLTLPFINYFILWRSIIMTLRICSIITPDDFYNSFLVKRQKRIHIFSCIKDSVLFNKSGLCPHFQITALM